MRVLVCPDKFRGTLSASEAAAAMAAGAEAARRQAVVQPLADGGEGTLEAFGGANRSTTVTGPLGDPVEAEWQMLGDRAVIEMARASGLALAGGAAGNDPLSATTAGTGELIAAAVASGARRVVVGLGGSATTDGGLGALQAMAPLSRLAGVDIEAACDVSTRFVEAAEVFGPQKGASPKQVELLGRRLVRLADLYEREHGIAVRDLDRSGAAGGLAGGLAAVGARLEAGFELIAEHVELYDLIEQADLVLTGEGALDASSFAGKVVGGVTELAAAAGVDVVAVVGAVSEGFDVSAEDAPGRDALVEVVDLSARFGAERARSDTAVAITQCVGDLLSMR